MNVPRKIPTDASNNHGLPLSNSMMPQLMKKANSANVRMAKANFIGADYNSSSAARKSPAGFLPPASVKISKADSCLFAL